MQLFFCYTQYTDELTKFKLKIMIIVRSFEANTKLMLTFYTQLIY